MQKPPSSRFICQKPTNLPVVAVMPPYSGDWLLMGDGAEGTSTEVADLSGENGAGEGVGAAGSLRIISSRISAAV